MPKRSNEFQQLVYLIQRQLGDRADTVVTESKMLVDRNTGKKREVDIVIDVTANGTQLIVAFECRGRSRNPTIEWVEQQIKKHEHLSDKLVLVANKPFTADALDLARRHGVDTIELSAAAKTDWTALIDELTEDLLFASFDFSVIDYSVDYEYPMGGATLDFSKEVMFTQGEQEGLLESAMKSIVRDHKMFGKPAMDAWFKLPVEQRKDEHVITLTSAAIPADNPIVLVQGDLSYRVTSLTVRVAAKIAAVPLPLGTVQYKDVRVVHGTTKVAKGSLAGQKLQVVMTERAGEPPKAALAISDGGSTTVHAAEFATPAKP